MLNKDKELFEFLSNAPKEFREGEQIKKFQMKNGDFIHCVLWNMHFYITGTDIVKILLYRFQTSNRQLINLKKFEEGIFSDLRNLKPGIDATLEGPRSEFLEFLYKNGCIRTQKKQKVFYWYSVPHDALFCDALERDLRRESNLQSYNKYISSLTRPPTEMNNYSINYGQRTLGDMGQRSLNDLGQRSLGDLGQRPLTDIDPRMSKSMDRLQIRPQSANIFDMNIDQKRIFDTQPFNTKNSSNIKVYPEFDNFEHDAFYREDVAKGTIDDFYSPSINKQINPSDFSKVPIEYSKGDFSKSSMDFSKGNNMDFSKGSNMDFSKGSMDYKNNFSKNSMDYTKNSSINFSKNSMTDFSMNTYSNNTMTDYTKKNNNDNIKNDFYSINKQNNLNEFPRSMSQPNLNLNDFDFLKERMEARVKEEEEKKNIASKKSMAQRDQFELFRKY